MRKFVFALLMLLTLSLNAQDNIIKFMGIPVDGTKSEMISKLKQKGFTYDYDNDMFKGSFNGDAIQGIIETYNDKVYNIRFIYDVSGFNKSMVINRFNSLVLKYDTNEKYLSKIKIDKALNNIESYQIDPYEDIDYEIRNGKTYFATYYYNYGKDLSDTTGMYQFKKDLYNRYSNLASLYERNIEEVVDALGGIEALYVLEKLEQDKVWFFILDGFESNTYNIMFYYNNKRNAPNGEDL